jgi:hypothetical protein
VPLGTPAALQYTLRERLNNLTQRLLLVRVRDDLWEASARAREALPAARLVELHQNEAQPLDGAAPEVAAAVLEFVRA